MPLISPLPSLEAERPEPRPSRFFGLNFGNRLTKGIAQSAAVLVVVLAAALVVVLVWKSWLSIETNGLGFFTTQRWAPQEDREVFGSLAFVWGTLYSSALAMLLAVPLGIGAAAFLAEIAPPWLRRGGSILVEMLAA